MSKEVLVLREIGRMQQAASEARMNGKKIAVVPTMGYLHRGHQELIRTAAASADIVITTVFVNPTQFGPAEDFSKYPRDLERDVVLADEAGTHIVFAPLVSAMYPEQYSTFVDVETITAGLEGKSRPGHFRGVATIVTKLFQITKPHVAVFGQKDAQQVVVVRRLIRDLNFEIELIVVPTVREEDGLALSSRNTYLSPEQRAEAPVLFHALRGAETVVSNSPVNASDIKKKVRLLIEKESSGSIDYVSVADGETLEELTTLNGSSSILISLAVRFGSTRLIDNIVIRRQSGKPKE